MTNNPQQTQKEEQQHQKRRDPTKLKDQIESAYALITQLSVVVYNIQMEAKALDLWQ